MAVDLRHQGHGLGAALLKHFMLKAVSGHEILPSGGQITPR
jgi:GNAT superfamily N-acetyltransferase